MCQQKNTHFFRRTMKVTARSTMCYGTRAGMRLLSLFPRDRAGGMVRKDGFRFSLSNMGLRGFWREFAKASPLPQGQCYCLTPFLARLGSRLHIVFVLAMRGEGRPRNGFADVVLGSGSDGESRPSAVTDQLRCRTRMAGL